MSLARRRIVTWIVGLAVLGGGATFVLKLHEFVRTADSGELPGFAFATVFSYFLATAGFLCLALWAFLRGHFRDIEEPKHRLLATEAELDRLEGGGPERGGETTGGRS